MSSASVCQTIQPCLEQQQQQQQQQQQHFFQLLKPSQVNISWVLQSSPYVKQSTDSKISITSSRNSSSNQNLLLKLEKKNLELCTETLGCENGAAYTVPELIYNNEMADRTLNRKCSSCRVGNSAKTWSFPPPLTTLSGGEGRVKMVSSRQDGRLRLIPTRVNVLQAEREDGRLRIRILPCKAFAEPNNQKDDIDHEEDEMKSCSTEGFVRQSAPIAAGCKEAEASVASAASASAAAAAAAAAMIVWWQAFLVASS